MLSFDIVCLFVWKNCVVAFNGFSTVSKGSLINKQGKYCNNEQIFCHYKAFTVAEKIASVSSLILSMYQ